MALNTSSFRTGALFDDGIYSDFTLEIAAPPLPVLATPVPILTTREGLGLAGPSSGSILLPGGSIIPASGGSSPPITVAGPGAFPELTLPDAPLTVTISGTAQQGQILMATTTGDVTAYQWQELIGGTWINLGGATDQTYVVQLADIGRQIRVEVTSTANLAATSDATNAVRDFTGHQYVYESADQTTVGSGLFQYVHGTATNTTIDAGGQQNIYSDGVASRTMVNIGGFQIDWGNASNTGIYGGAQIVWGSATDTTISTGQQIVMSGGTADGTEVDSNGEQVVINGGTARNAFVGGTQSVYGTADTTTISFGGLQHVHGLATNTTVRLNGHQNVYTDGIASGTMLSDGSVQIDWGTATNTTVGMDSAQYVWGVAINTTLSKGFLGAAGEQYVGAGGATYSTQVGAYATQYVHGGGASIGTVVNFLGNEVVYGTDTDATIFGGKQEVWGVATDAAVSAGGTQTVHAGGLARNTSVADFSSVSVLAGGTIENVTFGSGFGGIILDQGADLRGSISGWKSSNSIDLQGVLFTEGTTTLAYAASSDNSGGRLTVSDGTHAVSLSMLGQYSAADFAITSDGHGGTSVYNPIFLPDITITPPAA